VTKESDVIVNRNWLVAWGSIVVFSLFLYFLKPEWFDPFTLRQFFSDNLIVSLLMYFIVSTLRGFTLIPSTPLVLAGILVFPPLPLFLVNQLAVYTSSAIVYLMSRQVRFDHFFHERYPKQVERLTRLLHKRELLVISLWGFAPFVPTDMIVYVCSVLRIRLWKTLLGVSIGEGVICAIYIFGGSLGLGMMLSPI
jgi:uncharacterized membrane protein YdjX (TVP38/TMEM64 family)